MSVFAVLPGSAEAIVRRDAKRNGLILKEHFCPKLLKSDSLFIYLMFAFS